MSEPIISAETRAKFDEVKRLWSNESLFGKIRACIRFPFIVARNVIRKMWKTLT